MVRKGSRLLLLIAVLAGAGCTSPEPRRQESLEAADAAAARGDLERAAEILRRARSFDPRDPLITTRLGQIQEKQGSFGRALHLLDSFPDEVEDPEWRNLRARLLLQCGRYREAARIASALEQTTSIEVTTVETFSDIVVERKLAPKAIGGLPGSWFLVLVEAFLEQDDPATALSWMEQLPEGTSAAERVLEALMETAVTSENLQFVRRVDRLISPAESPMATLVHRRFLVLAGRETEVARVDSQFLARYRDHPGRGVILVAEARRHLFRGQPEEALRQVDEALGLDGDDVSALVLRGLALEWSGRAEEAEQAYRTALAVDPDNQMIRESLRSMREEPGTVVMRIESLKP